MRGAGPVVQRAAIRAGAPLVGRARLRIARGRSGRPNVSTITGVSSSERPRVACAVSRSVIPFGQEARPSFHAASSMFWAARPASKDTGPFPATTTATTRPAPSTLSGAKTVDASASTTSRRSTTTNVHGCRFEADPPGARVEDAAGHVLVQRVRQVATLVAAARDRQIRVHVSSVSAR